MIEDLTLDQYEAALREDFATFVARCEWHDHTLYSRLNDKRHGAIVIIMQRLHEDDLVGHVLAQEIGCDFNPGSASNLDPGGGASTAALRLRFGNQQRLSVKMTFPEPG